MGIPFFIFLYRVFGQNVSAILNSISTLENLLTLYFSQYHLAFDTKQWAKSLLYFFKFILSWFMIVVAWYVSIVFFFSFIFDITLSHPDTLFVFLGFVAIGIRFLVFKKGRQRGEVFSWSISICLFSFVAIGYVTQAYNFMAPTINNLGGQIITSFFSTNLNIHEAFIAALPSNPYSIIGALVLLIVAEITCFYNLSPEICGAWSLCYEIDSKVQRIIGAKRIIEKAKEMILEANERNKDILWVTTTSRIEIFSSLIDSSNKTKTLIVMLNSKFPASLSLDNISGNVSLKGSKFMRFPRGFLMIPGEKILITSFPYRDMGFSNPSIGFITGDISVIMKYSSIAKTIIENSTTFKT